MSEHTPLPWRFALLADQFAILGGDEFDSTTVCETTSRSSENEANAGYIVRTSNCHDALVSQLQRWLSWWDGKPDDDDSVPALISETKALLAKVGES